ncbi:MAG TPA: sugar ABC transporter substrate-binding protein [Lachnoclostridium sp.]|jgi:ribose transport system substrate-binding protein|uniref:sugar ABC transporter substrate-binding protein n=1 Tax=Lacrimispora sp. TaxID=2719234 RepID=UPI000ED89005|nr:sugar ABC transporter substrate-binding protein [Lacrimispora sp.]HCD46449.1 sugar ABC transporter substrate-binding protein [Lachnoclostridium sp.]
MKKSTKKLTAMLICAALAGISLAGCSNGEPETKAPETTAAATTAAETTAAAAAETKAAVKSDAGVNMADANVKKKDPSKHYKFGYTCMDGTNPFFVTIEKTMREMVEAQGDELISVDPANDVTLQITQVEDLISQSIDAMFMNPAEAEGILPALDQLKAANVPIVGFDTEVADLSYLISYTGSDNYNAGYVCGEDLVKKCPDGGDIIVLDSPTMNSVTDRTNGFLDAIKGHNFNIVAQQDAKGNLQVAMGIAEDLLQAHGDVVAIFGGNDPTALGALAAANAAGIKDCKIYGVDGSPDIKAEMATGDSLIEGSGAQSPVKIAQSAVNIMYSYLNGDKVDDRYPVETFLITSDNVKDYGTDGWQ